MLIMMLLEQEQNYQQEEIPKTKQTMTNGAKYQIVILVMQLVEFVVVVNMFVLAILSRTAS